MTKAQIKAVDRLQKALQSCYKTGLRGGVFDCSFCIWPEDAIHPGDKPTNEYFSYIEEVGAIIRTQMNLDGGSGV
jgi:hypothetical protein